MLSAQATYFDGISSCPHYIELLFDSEHSLFEFSISAQNKVQLRTDEVSYSFQDTSIVIHFGDQQQQSIKIEQANIVQYLKTQLQKKGRIPFYQRLISAGFLFHIILASALILLFAGVYFAFVPWLAEKSVDSIPLEFDNKAGNAFFNEFMHFQEIDTAQTLNLEAFARNIDFNNSRPIKFFIIKSDIKNAFALPNGYVIVYSSLIDDLQDYSELAGLLGHEVAHINQRHSMKMLCRNLSGYLLISTLLGDVNGILAVIGDNIHNINSLTYSRQFEKQADIASHKLMCKNGIDPNGMIRFFSRLKKESATLVPEFLSSHPLTEKRINYLHKLCSQSKPAIRDDDMLKRQFRKIKK